MPDMGFGQAIVAIGRAQISCHTFHRRKEGSVVKSMNNTASMGYSSLDWGSTNCMDTRLEVAAVVKLGSTLVTIVVAKLELPVVCLNQLRAKIFVALDSFG